MGSKKAEASGSFRNGMAEHEAMHSVHASTEPNARSPVSEFWL